LPYWLTPPTMAFVACILIVAFVSFVVRNVLRLAFGKDLARSRVKVPWRFSLMAIAVLTALVACVIRMLRDSPDVAVLAASFVLFLWFPIARFLEFRQTLAERRKKQLADALHEHQDPPLL